MYWVAVKRLKQDLVERRVSEHSAFSYFLAVTIFDAFLINGVVTFPGEVTPNVVSIAQILTPVAIIIVATLLLYRANGGASGESFFIRYFALVWVVGIRFLPLAIVVCAAWFKFVVFDAEDYSPTWYDLAIWDGMYALYYWRVWVHFNDVRTRALAT
jgi:hypothetical protein